MELPNSYWDKLASRYPRYTDESIRRDALFIFGVANDFGVEFENKTILDIGCGTGTLAIPLASKASNLFQSYKKLKLVNRFFASMYGVAAMLLSLVRQKI